MTSTTTTYDADTLFLRPTVLDLVADPAPHTRLDSPLAEWVWHLLRRCWHVGEPALAWQLIQRFADVLEGAGPFDRLDVHLARLMATAPLAPADRLQVGDRRVRLLIHLGDWQRATRLLAQLEGIAAAPADRARYANRMAVFWKERADYAAAAPYFEQALALARQTGDSDLEIRVLNNLGNWAFAQDDYQGAIGYYEAVLAHPAAFDLPRFRASALAGLAMVWVDLEQYASVAATLDHAEQCYGDYRPGVLRVWLNRAFYLVRVGQVEAAIVQGNAALELAQALGNAKRATFAYHNLGYAYFRAERWHDALHHLEIALTRRRALGLPLLVETTLMLVRDVRAVLVAMLTPPPDRAALLAWLDELLESKSPLLGGG